MEQKIDTPPAKPSISSEGDSKEHKLFLLWCFIKNEKGGLAAYHHGIYLSEKTAQEHMGEIIAIAQDKKWKILSSDIIRFQRRTVLTACHHVSEMNHSGFFVLPSSL